METIVVAAAGNSGTTTPFYPAADPRAVSVAGTTLADRRYSWSNFGAWVNVAAPGCNIAPLLAGGYGSNGAVQVGGSNVASGSNGAAQVGAAQASPAVGASVTGLALLTTGLGVQARARA